MGNYLISCVIRNDLLKLRRAKITERFKTRRFGVIRCHYQQKITVRK